MVDEIVSSMTKEYIQKLAESGKRIDGRGPDQFRSITVKKNVVTSAEGSAQVNLGDTTVIVGVKMEVGEPFADTPDKGVLTTNAELVPLASPTFEPGPPSGTAIELARVVDRGIRESDAIDLEKLCVVPKEKVWIVFIDIHVLDYDGNLLDAAAMGAFAALSSTTVPAKQFELGEDFKLPVNHYPISCTTAKVGSALLLDPSLDEERIADARLTVSTDENGDIRAMQKGLSGAFTYEDIIKVINMARNAGVAIREKILSD